MIICSAFSSAAPTLCSTLLGTFSMSGVAVSSMTPLGLKRSKVAKLISVRALCASSTIRNGRRKRSTLASEYGVVPSGSFNRMSRCAGARRYAPTANGGTPTAPVGTVTLNIPASTNAAGAQTEAIAGLLRDPAIVTLTVLALVALALGLQAQAGEAADDFLKHVQLLFIGTVAATGYVVSILAQHLHRQANTDPLTGLANRRLFLGRLQTLAARPGGRPHALLYLDLEAFKLANDTCGHAAGDRLLIEVTGRMLRRKPATATLARMEVMLDTGKPLRN